MEQQDIRAQVKAVQEATLSAEISAQIKELPVEEGGRFLKGEVLVVFDCATQEAQRIKAQAELAGATYKLRANE
jgi:multidrug efflux pump subunit AcrA (membrane-fusion protein)